MSKDGRSKMIDVEHVLKMSQLINLVVLYFQTCRMCLLCTTLQKRSYIKSVKQNSENKGFVLCPTGMRII